MVTGVHAGVPDFARWTPAIDRAVRHPPSKRVKKGAGPAGVPAPLHASTVTKVRCYTDGGCKENAKVNVADQLAGAGCVVLSADCSEPRAELYVPVITDPRHRCFLGATRGTNNTGELVGVGEALLWLRDYEGTTDDAVIYVDSKYASAMVEARWSFATNVVLIQCIQHILVQVRAVRNVTFRWVAGHSGDEWNDVADDLATAGQHVLSRVRWGCTEGRLDVHAARTELILDPREDPRMTRARADARALMPPRHALYRVTIGFDGAPVGFAEHTFAGSVTRVRWKEGRGPPATFSVRVVRGAMALATRSNPGGLHKCAAEVARACPRVLDMRWPAMWREGWGAPWPARVRDKWWELAAGGLYVAHLRRHHDPMSAFCRVCLARTGEVHMDTYGHLFYECPCHKPLWEWASGCLLIAGLETWHAAGFMLYGRQVLRCSTTGREVGEVRGDDMQAALRVASFVRASVVEAFHASRKRTMLPESEGVQVAHPKVEVEHARSLMRRYVEQERWAAKRTGSGGKSTANSRARQDSEEHFHRVWGKWAPEPRNRGPWRWCQQLTSGSRVDTVEPGEDAAHRARSGVFWNSIAKATA